MLIVRPLDRELINFAQTSSPTSGAGAGHFATGRDLTMFANIFKYISNVFKYAAYLNCLQIRLIY